MRTKVLLNSADASTQQISEGVEFEKRTWWKLYIEASGLNGTPHLYIEDSYTGAKTIPFTGDWNVVCNPCLDVDYTPINDNEVTIEKKDFKGNWFRIRIEPNDNTTGNISATIIRKQFV